MVQEIADFYMPAEVEPLEEAMKLRESKRKYRNWSPEERRAYHRAYMTRYRAEGRHRRGHIADKSDLTP